MSADADHVIGLYRRHARAWANSRGKVLREGKWLDRFVQLMPEHASVLDIGCGSGDPIGRYLLDSGCALTGIDASPELIEIARENIPNASWIVSDMRALDLERTFNGLLAWDSTFHLTHDDQRRMFAVFERHAVIETVLMFTSGPRHGEAIGEFVGEPLYHASLDSQEYQELLDQHGFEVIDHVVEDPECGSRTIWLAQYRAET